MGNHAWTKITYLPLLAALACSGGAADTDNAGSETASASETGDSTGDTSADETLPEYLKRVWGITINLDDPDAAIIVGDDGSQTLFVDGVIAVDGLGEQEISTTTVIDPASLGGQVSFFVSNLDLSDERYFLYDAVENYITIGDLTRGVAVSKNPDGTYDVWAFDGDAMDQFLTVPNGYEALKVVEQYNDFKSISPFLLLTAFASAHAGTPEARFVIECGNPNTAAPPPVCEIFKEFCDCAACLVLDRQGACDLCPEL